MNIVMPALPGQRVVANIDHLGLLRGSLQKLDYGTYLATIQVDGISDRPLHADIDGVALESTYDAMLLAGW